MTTQVSTAFPVRSTIAIETDEPLSQTYQACPLCKQEKYKPIGEVDCSRHPAWHEPLPTTLKWRLCCNCRHVYTASYWTDAGRQELFKTSHPGQVWDGHTDASRHLWGAIVDRVQSYLAPAWTLPMTWLDIGCGNGGLVMTACEFGFNGVGVDARREPVEAIRNLGYVAIQTSFADLQVDKPVHVISMMDMLEHTPWPVATLQQAHSLLAENGILVLSMPNMDCPAWRALQEARANPYWAEIEHHHNFTRQQLFQILESCGFEPLHYGVSVRYKACMEVMARRRTVSPVRVF